MHKEYRHDLAGPSIWTSDPKRPLDFTFEEFERWLKSEWDVIRWRHLDWRASPDPSYTFIIRWGSEIGWKIGQIEGLIYENKHEIVWIDECSADFVLDFVRKFVARFPANGDHLCFHNGDGGFSLYESDLNHDELYDRIVGEPNTLDKDLQKRIIASYSQKQNS